MKTKKKSSKAENFTEIYFEYGAIKTSKTIFVKYKMMY